MQHWRIFRCYIFLSFSLLYVPSIRPAEPFESAAACSISNMALALTGMLVYDGLLYAFNRLDRWANSSPLIASHVFDQKFKCVVLFDDETTKGLLDFVKRHPVTLDDYDWACLDRINSFEGQNSFRNYARRLVKICIKKNIDLPRGLKEYLAVIDPLFEFVVALANRDLINEWVENPCSSTIWELVFKCDMKGKHYIKELLQKYPLNCLPEGLQSFLESEYMQDYEPFFCALYNKECMWVRNKLSDSAINCLSLSYTYRNIMQCLSHETVLSAVLDYLNMPPSGYARRLIALLFNADVEMQKSGAKMQVLAMLNTDPLPGDKVPTNYILEVIEKYDILFFKKELRELFVTKNPILKELLLKLFLRIVKSNEDLISLYTHFPEEMRLFCQIVTTAKLGNRSDLYHLACQAPVDVFSAINVSECKKLSKYFYQNGIGSYEYEFADNYLLAQYDVLMENYTVEHVIQGQGCFFSENQLFKDIFHYSTKMIQAHDARYPSALGALLSKQILLGSLLYYMRSDDKEIEGLSRALRPALDMLNVSAQTVNPEKRLFFYLNIFKTDRFFAQSLPFYETIISQKQLKEFLFGHGTCFYRPYAPYHAEYAKKDEGFCSGKEYIDRVENKQNKYKQWQVIARRFVEWFPELFSPQYLYETCPAWYADLIFLRPADLAKLDWSDLSDPARNYLYDQTKENNNQAVYESLLGAFANDVNALVAEDPIHLIKKYKALEPILLNNPHGFMPDMVIDFNEKLFEAFPIAMKKGLMKICDSHMNNHVFCYAHLFKIVNFDAEIVNYVRNHPMYNPHSSLAKKLSRASLYSSVDLTDQFDMSMHIDGFVNKCIKKYPHMNCAREILTFVFPQDKAKCLRRLIQSMVPRSLQSLCANQVTLSYDVNKGSEYYRPIVDLMINYHEGLIKDVCKGLLVSDELYDFLQQKRDETYEKYGLYDEQGLAHLFADS